MARRKKRRRKVRPMKPGATAALDRLAELRAAARRLGVSITISYPTCTTKRSQRSTVHAQFNDRDDRRVLNWWPASGTWLSANRRGVAADVDEMLQVLAQEVGVAAPEPAAPAATPTS
jgi:hypothetical protein